MLSTATAEIKLALGGQTVRDPASIRRRWDFGVKCKPEHPLPLRRDYQWGFVSAEFVQVGDALFLDGLGEEVVATVERIACRARSVALRVPPTKRCWPMALGHTTTCRSSP